MRRISVLGALFLAATCAFSEEVGIAEKPVGEVLVGIPENVVWSPTGGSVLLSIINDTLNSAAVSEVDVETGERRDFPLSGAIRAFWASPDGSMLATIHEEDRDRVLQVWDTRAEKPEEIFRDNRSLYFPVLNTVNPWDPSGERLVFYGARFEARWLFVWDVSGEVVEVTDERRSDRAFWDPAGNLLVPQGVSFGEVLAGKPDLLTGLVEIDVPEMSGVFRPIPGGYTNIFPYSDRGVAILKNEIISPLVLDLETWKTSPLAGPVDRFLEVAWAPDGSSLAYPLNGTDYSRIMVFDVGSAGSRLLWVDDAVQVGSLDWSPSGRYLAASLLRNEGRPEARSVVLEAKTGEEVWSRDRDPVFVRRFFQRGRKSVRWHPAKDTLLLWDPEATPEGDPGVRLRVVEFGR